VKCCLNRIVIATILFIICISSLTNIVNTNDESNNEGTSNNCEIKVLVQVPFTSNKKNSMKDKDTGDGFWLHEVEEAVNYLKDKLESFKSCKVHVDVQIKDVPKPRHWWTPEFASLTGSNLSEVNLISNYNLVIFIGHGNSDPNMGSSVIQFLAKDPYPLDPQSSTNLVYFKYEIEDNNVIYHVHMHNKGWIMIIGCNVVSENPAAQLHIESTLFNRNENVYNLSDTELIGILGFRTHFAYARDMGFYLDIYIDDFIKMLADYLVNYPYQYLVKLWFTVAEKYKRAFDVPETDPAALFPRLINAKNNSIFYDPSLMIGLRSIFTSKSPKEAYIEAVRMGIRVKIEWKYVTKLDDVYVLPYPYVNFPIRRGGGIRLWRINYIYTF